MMALFYFYKEGNKRMKTDFSIDMNRKVELQNELIKNFEEEKVKLLDTIDTLEFEKDFDKKENQKSIVLAKALIETMEKQINVLKEANDEVRQLKELYKTCIDQATELKQNYEFAINDLIDEIRTELTLDNKVDKKRKIALLDRLKGQK